LFGLSSLGLILGSVTFIYTIGSAVGPLLSSYVYDITGSYRSAFFICALLDAVALIVVLTTLTKKMVETTKPAEILPEDQWNL
jgi:MFS family permease